MKINYKNKRSILGYEPNDRSFIYESQLKPNFVFGVIGVLILTFTVSCKKNLNLVSKDSVTDATFWKQGSDFKLAANYLYNGLDRLGTEDLQSDIAFANPNPVSNGTLLAPETDDNWTNDYIYIRSANNIIAKAAGSADAEIKRYAAEAKFFRAFYYWKLLRVYGGVPLITKVLTTDDPALFSPRSSRIETADLILKDLTEAAADLPLQTALAAADIGRITKGAAQGLAARVALFEGTWEKFRGDASATKYLDAAISNSSAVMSSNAYALYTGSGAQSYRYLFIEAGDDSKECILDRRYARGILGQSYPYDLDGSGYNPTRKMADLYLDKNGLPITSPGTVFQGYATFVSEFQNRDPRMTQTMIIPGTLTIRPFYGATKVANWPNTPQRNFNTGYILYKYMSEDVVANNSSQQGDNSIFDFDRHLIRYAEILLIYAEASYEKNSSISDADLDLSINKIRSRVGMPNLTNAFVTANGLNMRTEIRRERTVELCLEGFRYDDLRRWKTAETELPQDIKGIKITGSEWATRAPYNDPVYTSKVDANGFLIAEKNRKFDPSKDYLQPLPTKEVAFYATNGKVLAQNPGW
ncbi:RagB/SusD family nutrient uptake outer membrane protein [Mucilaginibacter corticis]|uniref:RagB/SusD family nutrient uptake outer membrane protein n=1 Tax=Mucilaginibacter corticis TaxID=2597670 RepID=A0A556MXC2_9SPHI|nr:RagB/SusD family nutrient uptake outer membrane protein [Mucilaginibacter corticis]TSJ44449.1 RagB/SusD family nutrient uptake outer membrane protein [Mucilaginibacter corticis]